MDETGEKLRSLGHEFGATTGRPRRCGWLDLPAMKYSIMINGITQLFMTKADVMSGFKTIRICTSYNIDGRKCNELPFDNDSVIEPVYTEFEGWDELISGYRKFEDLPVALKRYIEFIEKETGVPVTMVSVGPDREETIFRN
jgi:adenylosuccinate synthase